MPDPEGKLTPAQFEIMQVVWAAEKGVSVADIWESLSQSRSIARTTALNLVDRLEKRGWLRRRKVEGVYRYEPAVDAQTTSAQVAADFVDEFFAGSATQLVMSLLGSKKISKSEVERLRRMLTEGPSSTKGGKN